MVAAAIYHDKRVLGHGPKNGLEIPVKYKFIGHEKAIIWKKTQVNKKVNDIVKKSEHCMS